MIHDPTVAEVAVPAVTAVVGALVYAFAGNGSPPSPGSSKLAEIGRITFFVGLFWTVFDLAKAVVSL